MRKKRTILIVQLFLIGILGLFGSCGKTAVWEDAKTTGRYLKLKTDKFLWNRESISKLVQAESDFHGPIEEEFIPLQQTTISSQPKEFAAPQAKNTPGSPTSPIPNIEKFLSPSKDLATLFHTVHFNTDDHVIRDKSYYESLHKMALFLKKNANIYTFVEGHCDQRASEAYNQALGTRRANFVRNHLVKLGVKPDQLFTISYGKERLLDARDTKEAWEKNRRVEFKIFTLQRGE